MSSTVKTSIVFNYRHKKTSMGVLAQCCNPSTQKAEDENCMFEANLDITVSSQPARDRDATVCLNK